MIGKTYSSEKRLYRDEKTGKKIWQLTADGSNNYHFYFTDNSFTLGDQEIYFLSDRASKKPEIYNLFKMDLTSGLIQQLTNEKEGIAPSYHTKTPESDLVVYVSGNKVKKLDTKTLEATVIYEERANIDLGHPFIAPNKKYIGLARNEKISIARGANYKGFKETMYAVKKGWITLIYLDGTKVIDVYEDTHWLGHFQFSPDDSTIGMFCHEGPWNLVDQRMWLLDLVDRTVQPCFRQVEDDCVGHEFWATDGKIFFDNRRKGHDGTITSNKTQATIQSAYGDQIPYIGLADKNGEVLKKIDMPYYCNHYHANRNNTLLVGDEVEDLVLIDISGDEAKIETLCQHQTSWYTQQTHCHPTFSWSNEKILYTSDRDGRNNLYLIELNEN
ncbi:oligogalacturonate lyase family protein [Bacillus taeanensis]|uniref:Oligogalacturonate lyase domain-containing protein n=1 Tax=Bacillus taeanensis TaxID=273032 RepID=A0A366XX45_9BACI|nr:oligogalacturonate lyase family protein [Bacillus taeanensis]RBW69725.1 hypothetical protein DS031_09315 [Bacillus taeanensis]